MSDRTYDLVIYGATGFTGDLVVDHLAGSADAAGLRWAVAGRNREKLERVVATHGVDADIVIADAGDEDSIRAMAADTRVVCTTVGPYNRYGTPLVAACAELGTDYCDLTGEAHWVRKMIDAHQATAEGSGARILHSCGFNSIPSDLGVLYTQTQTHERFGTWASHIAGRLKAARGGASGGTIASLMDFVEEAAEDPAIAAVREDPYALNPAGTEGGDRGDPKLPSREPELDAWSAPFVMAEINTRVVRRSHALNGLPWGKGFSYDEAMLTGSGALGLVAAGAVAAGTAIGNLALDFGPTRNVIRRLVPKPGTGPSEETQRKGFWDFRFVATTDRGETLTTKVTGQGDPGYRSTSRMLAETALALAAGESTVDGGMWTPASALGQPLIDRLERNADVSFSVL